MKDFSKFQQEAIRTAVYPDVGRNLYYPALGIASEAGEVCGKIKKIMRDKNGVATKESIEDVSNELGDVLWYVAATAYELNIPLDKIAEDVLNKLEDRRKRGVIQGSGDNR
jgi:NTP pyrophosphatase (non-canonical NTP hydrolase)